MSEFDIAGLTILGASFGLVGMVYLLVELIAFFTPNKG